MKVSIIIPAFNAARFIKASVDSAIVCSAGFDAEVIVVDHASTDGTASVVPSDAKVVQAQPGGGPGRAKNVGLSASAGNLITFLDSDDVMVDLKARIDVLLGGAEAVFGQIAGLIDTDGNAFHVPSFDSWVAASNAKNRAVGSIDPSRIVAGDLPGYFTLAYKRALLDQVGHFDESLDRAEDFDLVYRCAKVTPITFVDVPSVLYRIHDANTSITRTVNGLASRPETGTAHMRALRKHGLA